MLRPRQPIPTPPTHAQRLASGFSPAEGPAGSGLAGVAGPIPLAGPDVKKPLPLLPASLSLSVFWQLVTRQQKSLLAADATSSSPSLAELPGLRPLWLPPLLLPLPFLLWGPSQRVSLWRVQLGLHSKNGREGEEGKSARREEQVVPGVLKLPGQQDENSFRISDHLGTH